MNNIKDKQNKITVQEINSSEVSIKNQLKNTFKLLTEKGQKIVTAIYMITDFLSKTDPMCVLIRDKSVNSMKCLFKNLIKEGDVNSLTEAQHNLYELSSYVSVIYKVGNISKMNYDILFQEINFLQKSIKKEIVSISHNIEGQDDGGFLLDLFKEQLNEKKEVNHKIEREKDILAEQDFLRDNDDFFIEEDFDLMSFKDEEYDILESDLDSEGLSFDNSKKSFIKNNESINSKKDTKTKRHENILNILEGKKNTSIIDICSFFEDCSSKTIQRDLKELIRNNRVVKQGDRRWAKYNLK